MGYETRCRARVVDASGASREGEGAVLLETDELIVRGEAHVRVPRRAVTATSIEQGQLTVTHSAGSVTLDLGPVAAAAWLARLQAPPKARIDKLDVKPGARVWLADVDDASLLAELRARTPHVVTGAQPPGEHDVVFLQVDAPAALARIAVAATALHPAGALWVIHPRGRDGVRDTDVFAVARTVGLTYTKVARFSETHTAEKLVRPKASR